MAISKTAASPALIRALGKQGPSQRQSLCFTAVKIFEGLEFLNESLVLVFKHSHTVFKTFDIFFLLPATLPGSFPGTNTRQMTTGTTSQHNPERLVSLCPPDSTAGQSLGMSARSRTTVVTKHMPRWEVTLRQQERRQSTTIRPASVVNGVFLGHTSHGHSDQQDFQ